MAKKHLKTRPSKLIKILNQPQAHKNMPALLREALQALRTGSYTVVLTLLSKALSIIDNPAQLKAAQEILAETHFRTAIGNANELRLKHLQEALKLAPDQGRLHFCLAVTLWQADRLAEANAELEITATHEPQRKGLAYLQALAALAQGHKPVIARLSQPEINTLQIVESLTNGTNVEPNLVDKSMLGNSQRFWVLLAEMQLDAQAAPWLKFQEVADKGGYKKTISTILNYYKGVGAMRAGEQEVAHTTWLKAQTAGFKQPWLAQNLRCKLYELVKQEKWAELISELRSLPTEILDPAIKEVVGLAYYRLGYQAALEGKWQLAAQYWHKASEQSNSCRLSQNLALAEEALENWDQAAIAWREMVRRRSRKTTTANYLNNDQVAAVWRRAAECYNKANDTEEAITCLKNALKYAENNLELRIEIADALSENGQEKAAQNELNRITTIAPDNMDALIRLGSLALNTGNNKESLNTWKRVLKIDPKRTEAKEALATTYLNLIEDNRSSPMPKQISFIIEALEELPEHPKLLMALAKLYESRKPAEAVELYRRAYQVASKDLQMASKDLQMVGHILHELLHVKSLAGGIAVEEICAQLRQIPRLPHPFWLHQGTQALDCALGAERAMQFFDEAVVLGEQTKQCTKAHALLDVFLSIHAQRVQASELKALDDYYIARIEDEVPNSGVREFIQGYKAFDDQDNIKEARRLFREAKQKARRANESAIIEIVEKTEKRLDRPKRPSLDLNGMPMDMMMRMMEMFPKGPPNIKDLKKLPPEEAEMLMKIIGAFAGESFEDFDY